MKTSLEPEQLRTVLGRLGQANQAVARRYAGESADRQPVHVVYGGANLFSAATPAKLSDIARRTFATYAPDPRTLATALGITATIPAKQQWLEETVFARVRDKLAREAIEDFRIDFEDGFGSRPDAEEDAAAVAAARELAKAMLLPTLPPFIGFRVKAMGEETKHRAARTLDLFLTALLEASGGKLPPNFVVTLPKITDPEQVEAFCALLGQIERHHHLVPGAVKLEIMVETTQSLLLADGRSGLPILAQAAGSRLVGAHLGAYDYTAACNITAAQQTIDHPACDVARHMMQVAFAGQPIWLSDGAVNVMPVGPHRGADLTPSQQAENRAVVHAAWRTNYGHVSRALHHGFYQGWDLHPAQFIVRYAACYAFFLDGLTAATDRLRAFMDRAAQATLHGTVFDDAATGQGLLNYFLRAVSCGAITVAEAQACGLTHAEIQTRSFMAILNGRRG